MSIASIVEEPGSPQLMSTQLHISDSGNHSQGLAVDVCSPESAQSVESAETKDRRAQELSQKLDEPMNSFDLLAVLMPIELEESNVLYDRLRAHNVPHKLQILLEQSHEAQISECIGRILLRLSSTPGDSQPTNPAVSRYSSPVIRPFSQISSQFDRR
ncbi:hypothetical protein BJX66DRAFT_319459 [Aspergillus keveii]|uniref:Uncharacterized protein n=1 Tax=Aspergillus keveii TaxID=714993 RepID=A0ABR4FI78_9EURO